MPALSDPPLQADQNNHRIRRVSLQSSVVTTLAGSDQGFVDGAATQAKLSYPCSIAICDAGGYALVVSGPVNSRVGVARWQALRDEPRYRIPFLPPGRRTPTIWQSDASPSPLLS